MGRETLAVGRLAVLAALVSPAGCAPTVDVLGVFFPGWLASTVVGLVVSYGAVTWLGRRPGTRGLADSGLFFLSLVVGIALVVWRGCFGSF